jgi:hypothetical protein
MYIKRPWIYTYVHKRPRIYTYVHKKAMDLYICMYIKRPWIYTYVHSKAMYLYICTYIKKPWIYTYIIGFLTILNPIILAIIVKLIYLGRIHYKNIKKPQLFQLCTLCRVYVCMIRKKTVKFHLHLRTVQKLGKIFILRHNATEDQVLFSFKNILNSFRKSTIFLFIFCISCVDILKL